MITIQYVIFLLLNYITSIRLKPQSRKLLLVVASIIFYSKFTLIPILHLLVMIALTYSFAALIRTSKENSVSLKLGMSVFIILLPLFINKYGGTLIPSITQPKQIIGLSFYTFLSLSYIIDTYRNDITDNNLLDVATYLSFFPHITQGPITKAKDFILQLSFNTSYSQDENLESLYQVFGGIVKKTLVSNSIGTLINPAYTTINNYTGLQWIVISVLYSLQLYIDFSAYSDIAIGSGKLLGLKLTENFKQPYFATSFGDFWRRWHISLNQWFTDYIYIPLGGSRKGLIRQLINIMIIFLISGIWHGSTLNFIVWGALHGLYQVIGKITDRPRKYLKTYLKLDKSLFYRIVQSLFIFMIVTLTWIFFRASTIEDANSILSLIFSASTLNSIRHLISLGLREVYDIFGSRYSLFRLFIWFILLFCIDILKENNHYDSFKNHTLYKVIVTLLLFLALVSGSDGTLSEFMYYDF